MEGGTARETPQIGGHSSVTEAGGGKDGPTADRHLRTSGNGRDRDRGAQSGQRPLLMTENHRERSALESVHLMTENHRERSAPESVQRDDRAPPESVHLTTGQRGDDHATPGSAHLTTGHRGDDHAAPESAHLTTGHRGDDRANPESVHLTTGHRGDDHAAPESVHLTTGHRGDDRANPESVHLTTGHRGDDRAAPESFHLMTSHRDVWCIPESVQLVTGKGDDRSILENVHHMTGQRDDHTIPASVHLMTAQAGDCSILESFHLTTARKGVRSIPESFFLKSDERDDHSILESFHLISGQRNEHSVLESVHLKTAPGDERSMPDSFHLTSGRGDDLSIPESFLLKTDRRDDCAIPENFLLKTERRDDCSISESVHLTSDRGDRPLVERHRVRVRRDDVMDSYRDGLTSLREESVRAHERAWHALSGHERAPSPKFEGSPHPISGYERLSVDRAHTMKDFEKQITELKKENFNLKLRIYFLEEQVQRRCDTSNDELHRMNIELKVEVESLKHDFQEKHNLLVRASKAMESLSGEHDLAVQRLRDEQLKYLQDMEDDYSHKLQLLEIELEHEKAELAKMCVLLDQEQVQRFAAEERLMVVNDQYTKSMTILEERDWIIQCLNETVHSKDALIAQLEKQIASMMPYEPSSDKISPNPSHLYLDVDTKDSSEAPNQISSVDVLGGKDEDVNEWQKKIKEMDNLISELQQKLEANKVASAAEEKNSLKRDKAIQGLTLALKKKTKENDKLLIEIQNLNTALSKSREAAQQIQNIKENVHPDYKKLVFTLQAEQDMYNRLLKYERESGSLHKELDSIAMLRRWLEESIQANQELRKIMEAQIMARYKGEDSMSFVGDQTSYLSICLDHLDQNEYFFAGGLQSKNNVHVGEMFKHLREEAGTQTQSTEAYFNYQRKDYIDGEDGGKEAKLTKNKQNTVSSATQTEQRTFSVDVSKLPKEKTELRWTLQDGEPNNISSQRLPQKTSNSAWEIQGYNFSHNPKKSRLPVLLKSSLNTKLKTDAALTLAKENDQSCLGNDVQIENSQLYEQLKCAEMESEPLQENHKPERNHLGQEQRERTEKTVPPLENHWLSEESKPPQSDIALFKAEEEVWRYKESDLYNSGQRESIERAIAELQTENRQLYERLKQAQREIERLQASEESIKYKETGPELSSFNKLQIKSTDQALQKELQEENQRLSNQLKRARVEIKRLEVSEEFFRSKASEYDLTNSEDEQRKSTEQTLREENYKLSEELKLAHVEIERLKANEELLRSKVLERDLNNSEEQKKKSTDQTLREENHKLSEERKLAQMEIERLKANEELLRSKLSDGDLSNSEKEQRKSCEQTLEIEIYGLSQQLKRAQLEIEALRANEELLRTKASESDLNKSEEEQRKSTEQALREENYGLSQQLKRAQLEIEALRANVELLRSKTSEHDLSDSEEEQRKSREQTLEFVNYRLSEPLTITQSENKALAANEELGLLRCKDSELDLHYSEDERRKSTEQTLQVENCTLSERRKRIQAHLENEVLEAKLLRSKASECDLSDSEKERKKSSEQALQVENHRLSEQLKQAQLEIEALRANEELIKHKDSVPGLTPFFKDQVASPDQSLQKEIQAEQIRLSSQLKTAQMQIEKLQAEQRSTVSSDDSLKLNGSDADDDLSEQSFLDKTITNSVNVTEVDVASDFGDEVHRPNAISQNAVALRCHHDSHCTECANNRGVLPLPTSNSKKASTMHASSKFTKVSSSRRSFDDATSLSKYDLLVQSQARELSLQRQKIKESHNLSVICSKNFYNVLKAFENLFPPSALDSNITLGFQEQITQTVEWLKELEYKLSDAFYGEEDAYSDQSVDSLLYTPSRLVPGHRMWADKRGCHVLGLVEDYNALRKQILEARNVLQEMEAFTDHGVQTAVLNMTENFGNVFFEKLTRTKQSLEEAGCLLKLLWKVSLPLQIHSPYTINQEEDVHLEITRLRKRVLEQEKLLSGMVKRVYSENQMKEDIEKLIMDQLAMTHDILKRAKGNLEVQVVEKLL